MSLATSWLVIGLVVVSLWGLWLWLGFIFDAISDYYQAHASTDPGREDSPPDGERGD